MSKDRTVDSIKKWWTVVVFIFTLGGLYAAFNSYAAQIKELQKESVESHDARIKQDVINGQIMVSIVDLKNDTRMILKELRRR